MAGRYNFVSPGALAQNEITQELMRRATAERQQQLDEEKRQSDLRQAQHQQAMLDFQRQQEARIAEAQRVAQEDVANQRAFTRASTIHEYALPGQTDQATADLLTKQGFGDIVTRQQPTQGAYQGEDASGVPQYDVIPGVLSLTGGTRYQAAQSAQQAAAATAAANNAAALERTRETNQAKADAAAAKDAEDRAATPTLTGQALDMAARMYAKTGQLPSMGLGKQGAALKSSIINRASQYDVATDTFGGGAPPPDIASNKRDYTATSQAVTQLTKNSAAVNAFEETARKNSALLEDVLKDLPGGNLPTFINAPVRSLASAMGSEKMARFNALRQSVQNEFARLVSQPSLAGTMSDSARQEMETIMSPNATVGQIRAAMKALQEEAANRKQSFDDQIKQLKQPGSATTDATQPKRKYYDAQGNPVTR